MMSDLKGSANQKIPFPVNYNTADEEEENPDLLRAESMALATPLSIEYSDKFYSSLQNIEASCSTEMEVLCPTIRENVQVLHDLSTLSDPFIFFMGMPVDSSISPCNNRRRLTEEVTTSVHDNNGLKLLTTFRDHFLNGFGKNQEKKNEEKRDGMMKIRSTVNTNLPVQTVPISPPPIVKPYPLGPGENMYFGKNHPNYNNQGKVSNGVTKMKSIVGAENTKENIPLGPPPVVKPLPLDSESKGNTERRPFVTSLRGPHVAKELEMRSQEYDGTRRKLFLNMNKGTSSISSEDSNSLSSNSDSEGDNSNNDTGSHHHHHGHHKYHSHHYLHGEEEEDVSFTGALGFGAQRDLCLYENFDQLSSTCQSAVIDHYRLRQDYWQESSSSGCHGVGILLWVIVFLLGYVVVRRLCGRRCGNRKAFKKIMETIRANPSLKATIEAEAGVQVPEKRNCRTGTCCHEFVLVLLTLLSAFMIAVSSLLFTVTILNAMMPPVDETGQETQPPSVPFAIFVLTSVCSAEVGLFFIILHGFCRSRQSPSTTTVTATDVSAPLLQESSSSSSSSSHPPSSPRNGTDFYRFLTWMPIRTFNSWTFPRNSSIIGGRSTMESGYMPLMSSDETQHDHMQSEMVNISQHGSTPSQEYIVQPVAPYSPYVGVTIPMRSSTDEENSTAQPVSYIRMI